MIETYKLDSPTELSNNLYKLQDQYTIKTLCRVLKVNRNTYYKHFYSKHAPLTCKEYLKSILVVINPIKSMFISY